MQATDAKIVKRLEGGMSNYTYVVECQGGLYTYRVPGKFAERFVDRVEEDANIKEVEKLTEAKEKELYSANEKECKHYGGYGSRYPCGVDNF